MIQQHMVSCLSCHDITECHALPLLQYSSGWCRTRLGFQRMAGSSAGHGRLYGKTMRASRMLLCNCQQRRLLQKTSICEAPVPRLISGLWPRAESSCRQSSCRYLAPQAVGCQWARSWAHGVAVDIQLCPRLSWTRICTGRTRRTFFYKGMSSLANPDNKF